MGAASREALMAEAAGMQPGRGAAYVRAKLGCPLPADRYWLDPAGIMRDAGMEPDEWQERLLQSSAAEILLLAARQHGKSAVAAALSLMTALREPGSLTLLLSPSARQSEELLGAKVMPLYRALKRRHPQRLGDGGRLAKPGVKALEFASGSRIIALPDNPDAIVGYSSVSLLVVDEAARAPDILYLAVRPMLAVSQGRIICLSTPYGKRGFFFDQWQKGEGWERYEAKAGMCPRISEAFLRRERRRLGERWYNQEYLLQFNDSVDSVFSAEDIAGMETRAFGPLYPELEADDGPDDGGISMGGTA